MAFSIHGLNAGIVSKSDRKLGRAFDRKQGEFFVRFRAMLLRKLPTDNRGIRHQQFLVELSTGQTLLIAHNIDLAPRVKGLRRNTAIRIFGEYIWNREGGIIHLTHRNTSDRGPDGWIKYRGKKYE